MQERIQDFLKEGVLRTKSTQGGAPHRIKGKKLILVIIRVVDLGRGAQLLHPSLDPPLVMLGY